MIPSRAFLLLLLTLPLQGELAAQVYVQEDQDFRNSSFVRVSDDVAAELFFAAMKAGEERWAEAVNAYQQVLDREAGSVVEFGPRVFVAGAEAARRRIEDLPPKARDRYAELFSARAAAAAAQALRLFDVPALMRVARRYPFTPSADRSLRAAAELAAERGDLTALARAVDLLLERGAASAGDLARYGHALGDAADGNGLAGLMRRAGALLDDPVRVAGAERTLREFLNEQRERSDGPDARHDEQRLARGAVKVEVLARMPFEERTLMAADDPDPLGDRPLRLASVGAALADDVTWVAALKGLYRFDGAPGSERPVVRYDDAVGHDPAYHRVSSRSLEPASDGHLLYFTFNEAEHSLFGGPTEERGQLICVDARQGGKIVFQVRTDAGDTPEELAGFVLEGPPRLFGDLVIVSGSRLQSNTECALFGFDRTSGALRWSRFLASAARVTHYDSRNRQVAELRAAPAPITIADGVVYCVTNVGIVAAVNAIDGEVKWLFKYNRIIPDDPDRYTRVSFYDTGGWHRTPPFVVGERLIVAPEDSRFLYVLARQPSRSGHLRLNDPIFKGGHRGLLAVDGERELLLFAGEVTVGPRLGCLKITATDFNGSLRFETPPFEIEERITGSPLLLADRLLLPTNKALYRLDVARDLLLVDHVPVPEVLLRAGEKWVFGNLSYGAGQVTSASPMFVLAVRPEPE